MSLDPTKAQLSAEERSDLLANIQLLRDAIVLFTATGAARGVSGHTGMFGLSETCRQNDANEVIEWRRWSIRHSPRTVHSASFVRALRPFLADRVR